VVAGRPFRPQYGHRKGARAPVSRGEQDARARREEGGGKEEWPTVRKSPASSAMLRRAIPVAGGLTTGNWCEHGLRKGEAGLGAR
jgi:hypothetical protein